MANFFARLFGQKNVEVPMRDVAALVQPLKAPAVHLVKTDEESLSHFGGRPDLPAGVAWPERDGRKLAFLLRLSLAEVQRVLAIEWLPSSGALLFFYDVDEQPWGYDPKDRGACKVLHVPDLPQAVASPADGQEGGASSSSLPHRNVALRRIEVLPSWERESVRALNLSDKESDALFDLADSCFAGEPKHQLGGFPSPVQGDDMELECQLVTHGLYCGDERGYQDDRAAALKPGARNWRLLLQLDSDDDLGIMWGDCGTIYCWVEEDALTAVLVIILMLPNVDGPLVGAGARCCDATFFSLR